MINTTSVLVVEDETLILLDIADQLKTEGYKVYMAVNADVALELLAAHPDIQLIFTDIDMPGEMNGLKLAAAVRDRWPPVKIIVTSGRHTVEISDLPTGSVFFKKPYRHLAVMNSMREMLATA